MVCNTTVKSIPNYSCCLKIFALEECINLQKNNVNCIRIFNCYNN